MSMIVQEKNKYIISYIRCIYAGYILIDLRIIIYLILSFLFL